MAKSATDTVQDIINAAVVDAIVALKDASNGLPNALLRDVDAIHANTALGDLSDAVRSAVASSVRDAFTRLRKDGYVVAEAKSVQNIPGQQEHRPSAGPPTGGQRRPTPRPSPKGRPRPSR
jgi:hypothetical protein